MRRRSRSTLFASVALALVAGPGDASAAAQFDLNSDGRQEVVVGLPNWRVDSAAGGVAVVRGSRRHLLGRSALLTQQSLGLEESDWSHAAGAAVASDDFNADGFPDLAFGAPFGDSFERGRVISVNGSPSCICEHPQVIPSPPRSDGRPYSSFGAVLAAGNVNGDHDDDLVVGGLGDLMMVLFGGPGGLSAERARTFYAPADISHRRAFGAHIAVGDLNRDGFDDIVEGYEGDPIGTEDHAPRAGHVTVAYGGPEGPTAAYPLAPHIHGGPSSFAVGDVTGDGYPEVVAGTPVERYFDSQGREVDPDYPAGGVKIWRGGPAGPTGDPMTVTQETPGVPGSDEQEDEFGASVAVGRLDGDRFAEILVGAPGEDHGAGRATVLRGARRGVARHGSRALGLATPGVPGRRDYDFGLRVALLDLSGDGRRDLAIGNRRAVTALRGDRRSLFTTRGAVRLKLSSLGVRWNGSDAVLGRPGSS